MTDREKNSVGMYACPCCGYATISEPAGYEICRICFWEDDGQDDPDARECFVGPNHVSLVEGRRNFLVFGAAEVKDIKHVRVPTHNDENLRNYRLEYTVISEPHAT